MFSLVGKLIIIYILVINCISFSLYGIDKTKAKHSWWRIPEKILLLLPFIGGAIGAIVGMYTFRHKTKKLKFKICNYLGLIMWIYILITILK